MRSGSCYEMRSTQHHRYTTAERAELAARRLTRRRTCNEERILIWDEKHTAPPLYYSRGELRLLVHSRICLRTLLGCVRKCPLCLCCLLWCRVMMRVHVNASALCCRFQTSSEPGVQWIVKPYRIKCSIIKSIPKVIQCVVSYLSRILSKL